jgi:hypothetical protein
MDFFKDNFGVFLGLAGTILAHLIASVIAFIRLKDRVVHNEADCKACKESVMGQIEQVKKDSREDFAEMKAITGKLSDTVNSLSNVVARLEILAEMSVKHQ